MIDGKWLDRFQQIKARPEEQDVGPNNLLFSIQRCMLDRIAGRAPYLAVTTMRLLYTFRSLRDGRYKQTPSAPDTDHCSHDDMTAMVAWAYLYRDDPFFAAFLATLKVWRVYWHPRDLLFYNWCKGGWRRRIVLPVFWLMIPIQLWSILYNGKKPYLDTDGDILAWVRCQATRRESWVMAWSWNLCTLAVERKLRRWSIDDWKGIFGYYHMEGHPNRAFETSVYEGGIT